MIALKLNYINYTLFVFTETLESVSDDNQRRTNQSQRKEQEYLDSYLHETLLKSECYLHLSWLNGVCVTATLHYTTAAAVSRWSELDNFAVGQCGCCTVWMLHNAWTFCLCWEVIRAANNLWSVTDKKLDSVQPSISEASDHKVFTVRSKTF